MTSADDQAPLAPRRCVPCERGGKPLDIDVARGRLAEVPEWSLTADGRTIERTVKHKTFPEAIAFVTRVAEIAEREGHHPDIDIRWRRVKLVLSTHSIGGLSDNDFILAAKIDGAVTA